MGFKSRISLGARLRTYALGLPEAYEEHPWGESVAKVNKKVFVFLGRDDYKDGYSFSVKLPNSGEGVLNMPFAKPTGYGLGKSGWVSISLAGRNDVPFELLCEWVDESYRAVAPKKLSATLST